MNPPPSHVHVTFNETDDPSQTSIYCDASIGEALEHLTHDLTSLQGDYFANCEATSLQQQESGSDCCPWCDTAYTVAAHLDAITDRDAHAWFTTNGGHLVFRVSPPEGADRVFRIDALAAPREGCPLLDDQ